MARDTSAEVERILSERRARLSPAERMEEGLAVIRVSREMMRAGIRARHPDYDSDRVEHALARLLWGDGLYCRAYPGRELPVP